jgi:serine/threonine protein phosphatase 1
MGMPGAYDKAKPLPGTGARPTPGRRLYAIGDIHGRLDLLDRLLDMIQEDVARRESAGTNVLIYLGDYVDRGPDSAGVLERLLAPLPGFDVVRLLGNHEAMMRAVLAGDEDWLETWRHNGAAETLESYGIAGEWGPPLIAEARRRIPLAHRRLLDSLATCHVDGDYLFVHAGLRPGVALDRQDPEDLVWIRRAFLDSGADFGHIVVHGHSISPEVVLRPNRIGIDTGAYRSGVLTALVLENTARGVFQTA